MKKLLTALSLFTLALSSCEKDTDEPEMTTADYYPMTTGSYWIYDSYNFNNAGTQTAKWVDSIIVGEKKKFNGNDYSLFKNYEVGRTDFYSVYTRKENSAYFSFFGETANAEHLMFKFNVSIGEGWTAEEIRPNPYTNAVDTSRDTYTLKEKAVTAVVNGITFKDVIKYSVKNLWINGLDKRVSVRNIERWFAKGVGYIYDYDKPVEISDPTFESKIKRYKVN